MAFWDFKWCLVSYIDPYFCHICLNTFWQVDSKPVGMIAVTGALDPKILAHFQLDTYNGLISTEVNLNSDLFFMGLMYT